MSRCLTVSIPVYPVVLKFLKYHYEISPFALNQKGNIFSSFLYAHLQRHPVKEPPRRYEQLSATLTASYTASAQHLFGGHLSPVHILAFNEFTKKAFLDKICEEIQIRTSFGKSIKESILDILNRYKLTEDELPYRTMERYYQRSRATGEALPGRPQENGRLVSFNAAA